MALSTPAATGHGVKWPEGILGEHQQVAARWRCVEKGVHGPTDPSLSSSVRELGEADWAEGTLIHFTAASLWSSQTGRTPCSELMAKDRAKPGELDQEKYDADDNVKIICLGDSAVGKSKYVGSVGRRARPPWASVAGKTSGGAEEHGFYGSPERGSCWPGAHWGNGGVASAAMEPRHEDSGDRAAARSPGGSCRAQSMLRRRERGFPVCRLWAQRLQGGGWGNGDRRVGAVWQA